MEDNAIIELFFARSEQAIGELDRKYGKVCYKISFHIVNSRQDAEECVNDAYLGAWNAIPPARPDPLLAYICKIVRNISLKAYYRLARRNSVADAALAELEEMPTPADSVEREMEAKELAHIIDGFLATLRPEDRVLFMRRYAFLDPYAEIADRLGMTEKNVSVRLTRLRRRLRKYLIEKEVLP